MTSTTCAKTESSLAREDIPTYIPTKSNLHSTPHKPPSSEPMAISRALQPSSAYLAIARSPSARAPYPDSPRKLLILDLNGTLLLRPKPRHAKRPIHPRPYIPSFRSYLFHESVKPWLDVMVWSSAQPRSVNNMVTRCFGGRRDELKAIWARDTLGLEDTEYSRKVETIKDLEKCWSVRSDSLPSHTAETTLLLDDSTGKALLQPHNHICVPEYTQNLRNRDLITKARIAAIQKKEGKPRKRAKKRKKRKPAEPYPDPHAGFDPTLVAVIGVLEEIKEQTNLASWIQAGGLWAGHGPPSAPASPFELFSDKDHDTKKRKLSTTAEWPSKRPRSTLDATEGSSPSNNIQSVEDVPMWFDHQPCFDYWVDQGTRAAEALGIKLEHGIGA